MDVIIGCFLASAALLGIGIVERVTAGRTSQSYRSVEPVAAPQERPMVTLIQRR